MNIELRQLRYFVAVAEESPLRPRRIRMQTIVGRMSAGMGIALVPQSVSNLKRPGVEYRPLAETGLAWRRDNPSPVLHAFLELLRKK